MNPRDVTGEGASSILRAVGSLLVALSGGDQAQAERTLSTMQDGLQGETQQGETQRSAPTKQPPAAPQATRHPDAQPGPERPAPPPRPYPQPQGRPAQPEARTETPRPRPPEGAPADLLDEVEFVLADARDRAQAIIDESTDRARELIRQERLAHAVPVTGIDPSAFDDLRRGLRGLVTEVRDIQQRLARIEQLIRDQDARASSHTTPHAAASTGGSQNPSASVVAPRPAPSTGYASYPEPRAAEVEPLPAWQAPEPSYDEPTYDEPDSEAQSGEPEYEETGSEEPRYDDDTGLDEAAAYAEPEFESSTPTAPSDLDAEIEAEAEPEAPAPFEVPAPPFTPAPAPPRSTFSVVPPQRREWDTPDPEQRDEDVAAPDEPDQAPAWESAASVEPEEAPAAFEPPPAPPRSYGNAEPATEFAPNRASWDEAYDTSADADASAGAASVSPLVTFLPSDGAITLRLAPVAGFQGLMRIQDALTRLPVVRHASVEAYSQGEARLRIELSETADSDEIAEGLSRALRGTARVEDASEVNRELLITLR